MSRDVDVFLLDLASVLERFGDDGEVFAVVADVFVDDVENHCRALSVSLAARDAASLYRQAHTIKGLLATFSDQVGAAMALAVERLAQAGTIASGAEVRALQSRLREVAQALANCRRGALSG